VSSLIADVAQLSSVNGGELNSLTKSLQNVLAALQKGNAFAAAGELGSFINKVNALQSGGRLSASDAASLISAAQAVINAIRI
jgi:hypothetical protein